VANAYVSDISTDETRSRNFGWMAASSNAGFVVGPALAGVLGSTAYGELVPVLIAAAISLVATLVIWLVLPESNPCAYASDKQRGMLRRTLGEQTKDCFDAREPVSLRTILRQPNVPLMIALYLLIFLAFNVFYTAFPNHAATALGWDVARTGWFFTTLSGAMILVQSQVLPRLAKRFPEHMLVTAGGAIMAVCFLVLTVPDDGAVFGAALLFAIGNGVMWSSYMALLARTGEARLQGSIQGIASSAGGLASIIGLVGGGILYTAVGEYTFGLAAVVITITALLARSLARTIAPSNF